MVRLHFHQNGVPSSFKGLLSDQVETTPYSGIGAVNIPALSAAFAQFAVVRDCEDNALVDIALSGVAFAAASAVVAAFVDAFVAAVAVSAAVACASVAGAAFAAGTSAVRAFAAVGAVD